MPAAQREILSAAHKEVLRAHKALLVALERVENARALLGGSVSADQALGQIAAARASTSALAWALLEDRAAA